MTCIPLTEAGSVWGIRGISPKMVLKRGIMFQKDILIIFFKGYWLSSMYILQIVCVIRYSQHINNKLVLNNFFFVLHSLWPEGLKVFKNSFCIDKDVIKLSTFYPVLILPFINYFLAETCLIERKGHCPLWIKLA